MSEAKAAIAAYRSYNALVNAAVARPGQDWSKQAEKVTADPVRTQTLDALKGLAGAGQYGTGTIFVDPKVTKVDRGVVYITACVDAAHSALVDKNGKSIKAPNQAGSYFRHPSQIQVGKFITGAWLVTVIVDDYQHQC